MFYVHGSPVVLFSWVLFSCSPLSTCVFLGLYHGLGHVACNKTDFDGGNDDVDDSNDKYYYTNFTCI